MLASQGFGSGKVRWVGVGDDCSNGRRVVRHAGIRGVGLRRLGSKYDGVDESLVNWRSMRGTYRGLLLAGGPNRFDWRLHELVAHGRYKAEDSFKYFFLTLKLVSEL
jgi:hypothetical protein